MVNCPEQALRYTGHKVRKSDWVAFIQNVGFKEYARRCVTEETVPGGAAEAKFLEKVKQMKANKRGAVLYEDGTVFDGTREAGRPQGRGSLVWPDKQGTYDGDFIEGRRHGYGVMSAYLGEKKVAA